MELFLKRLDVSKGLKMFQRILNYFRIENFREEKLIFIINEG